MSGNCISKYFDEEDTPERCRQRRQRRIQLMRSGAVQRRRGMKAPVEETSVVAAAGNAQAVSGRNRIPTGNEGMSSYHRHLHHPHRHLHHPHRRNYSSSTPSSSEDMEASWSAASAEGAGAVDVVPVADEASSPPDFGIMSVIGRLRSMEDAVFVRTNLCRPVICRRRPVHFFAVFDGHGGSQVAEMCKERMHVLLEEELMRVELTGQDQSGAGPNSSQQPVQPEQQQQERQHFTRREGAHRKEEQDAQLKTVWRTVLRRTFQRMDEMALSTCVCGSVGFLCGCHPIASSFTGSTATVVVITPEYIIAAYCGDSRAVLGHGGRAIPLSVDHKPDRPDELARIKAAGGQVLYVDGARVQGILAMSRAVGDKYLKPFVTSEPEITFRRRESEDECLVIASDGLWDTTSNQLACDVVRECLEGRPISPTDADAFKLSPLAAAIPVFPSRTMLAAALLTRLALGRGSSDNISVIAIDLTRR